MERTHYIIGPFVNRSTSLEKGELTTSFYGLDARLSEKIIINVKTGKIIRDIFYIYNDFGDISHEIHYKFYDIGTCSHIKNLTFEKKIKYVYDEYGFLKEKIEEV